jgi:hypothetical protein
MREEDQTDSCHVKDILSLYMTASLSRNMLHQ